MPRELVRAPALTDSESPIPAELVPKLRDLLMKGYAPSQVARRLARGPQSGRTNPRFYKIWKARIHAFIAQDEDCQLAMGHQAKGRLIAGLPDISDSMVRRGSKGNVMAAKLVYASTGFYNPKQLHDHSGQVEIVVKNLASRPPTQEDAVIDDADVVEN